MEPKVAAHMATVELIMLVAMSLKWLQERQRRRRKQETQVCHFSHAFHRHVQGTCYPAAVTFRQLSSG